MEQEEFEQQKNLKEIQHRLDMQRQEIQHRFDMQRQLVQVATDYALKGLHLLFLLNGSAAVYIIAAKLKEAYGSLALFALGCVAAIIAIGAAYYTNLTLSGEWKIKSGNEPAWYGKFLYGASWVAVFISLTFFVVGLAWMTNKPKSKDDGTQDSVHCELLNSQVVCTFPIEIYAKLRQ